MVSSATTVGFSNQFVRLDYNLTINDRSRSTIFIELYDDRVLTTPNFMQYVNAGRYDGMFMHRLARNFVLQGGGFYPVPLPEPEPVYVSLDPTAVVDLDGNPATPNPTVNNEYLYSNLRGTIAMARIGGQPNSATNQWFVNLENNTGLNSVDGGFTVFGKVAGDGMALLDVYNSGLSIINMNPDVNNDGTRDGGPFYNNSTDGVPAIVNQTTGQFLLLVLNKAQKVDYLGPGSTTGVPTGGFAFTTRDAFIDSGASFTGTGPIVVGAGRTLGIRENYSLTRQLINHGTVEPGLQLGIVGVSAFQQSSTGTLAIQLRGTDADDMPSQPIDDEHDSLFVIGQAQLDGKLDISLINQYMPVHGTSFTVLSAASISGSFSTVELPLLNPGLVWSYQQSNTAITLRVQKADFNQDGVVNAADYVLWRDQLNRTGTGLSADANGDMVVNAADLAIWKGNFGSIRGNVAAGAGSTTAVPEPSAVALVAMLAAIAVWSYRSRIRCCRFAD